MGLLGGLKKVGKVVGGVAKRAAPIAAMIPGVGTVAGAAIGGLGSRASGDNLKTAIGYGIKGALPGALGKLGGLGGVLGGLKRIGGGGAPSLDVGDLSKVIGNSGMPGGAAPGLGSSGKGGVLGSLGSIIGGAGGLGGILGGGLKKIGGVDGLLGGAATGYGAYQMKQAGDMRNKALKMVEQDYASRAPLRSQGLAGMLNEQRPDLSSTFASNNPFSRRVA
jgi:hypothetical protein